MQKYTDTLKAKEWAGLDVLKRSLLSENEDESEHKTLDNISIY